MSVTSLCYTTNDLSVWKASQDGLIPELTEYIIKLDTDKLKEFIGKCRPAGLFNVCFIDPTKKSGMTGHTFLIPDKLNQCVKYALAENKGGKNTYFSVNPPLSIKHGKLSGKDINAIEYAHVDIDPDIEKNGNYKAARKALIESIPDIIKKYSPTFIIDTGNGLGVYWKHINPLMKEQGESINKLLIDEFNGDAVAYNSDRLMRLPFTLNYPSESKLNKGYPSEPSRSSVRHYAENNYYTPEIFEHQMAEFKAKVTPRKVSNVIQKRNKSIPPDIPYIKDALSYIDPTERGVWVNTGFSLHYEFNGDETGFSIFNEWSSTASTYQGEVDCRMTWNTLNQTERTEAHQRTLGSLYDDAVAGGWNKYKVIKHDVLITDTPNKVVITETTSQGVTIK